MSDDPSAMKVLHPKQHSHQRCLCYRLCQREQPWVWAVYRGQFGFLQSAAAAGHARICRPLCRQFRPFPAKVRCYTAPIAWGLPCRGRSAWMPPPGAGSRGAVRCADHRATQRQTTE